MLFGVAIIIGGAAGWWWRTTQPSPVSGPPVSDQSDSGGGETVDPPLAENKHPLDPALDYAREGLERIRSEVRDYTATMTKQELISGRLVRHKLFMKVRERKRDGDQIVVPFSVYLKFLEPPSLKGREVIWVENRNDGKLVAHEGGFKNLLRVNLPPTSMLAMLGNRYPITDIGIENLIAKLIKRGELDKEIGPCEVEFKEDQPLGDHKCRVIQITHPEHEPRYDFFRATIYIDSQRQIPLRYTALVWPENEGDDPVLDEQYIYENVQLNAGLTDKDFDPDNENYNFP